MRGPMCGERLPRWFHPDSSLVVTMAMNRVRRVAMFVPNRIVTVPMAVRLGIDCRVVVMDVMLVMMMDM